MTKYNKAIAAFVGALGAFAAAKWGFDLTPELQATIVTAVTTLLVYIVPNKKEA
jgi:hypothetical protein